MTTAALPAEITIDNVAATRQVWREWLDAEATGLAKVDASNVEQIDSAGVQLLISIVGSARDQGVDIRWVAPSAAMRDACDAMGASAWLNLTPALAGDGHTD